MKQKLRVFLTLLLCAVASVGWADESTLTFTAACNGSGTADDDVEWTITSDAAESTYDSTKGIHYGTSKVAVSYLNLSTSGIPGTITSITVNASGASGTTAVLNVSVGGSSFGTEKSLTATATEYTLTGTGSGEIVVSVTQSSTKKALYVKSVKVTYTTGTVTPIVKLPVLNPSTGSYTSAPNVEITCETEGATIYYTKNGEDPTTSSSVYRDPITITLSGTTLKAMAAKEGMDNSPIVSATYTIQPDKPTISIDNGAVTISAEEGLSIYYTINGDDPTTESASYTGTFSLEESCTVKAIAVDEYGNVSQIASEKYVNNNVFAKNLNTYYYKKVTNVSELENGDAVLIANEESRYVMSTDQKNNNRGAYGLSPSEINDGVIDKENSNIQRLTLVKEGDYWYFYTGSGYLYAASSSGNYLRTKEEKDDNAKAAISISNGNASVVFQGTNTRKVMQYNSQLFACYASASQKPIQLYVEVERPSVAAPTFSVEEGIYDADQTVEISCEAEGATIYYTLDGSEPTNASTEYTTAITITETTTIKAVAYVGDEKSNVSSVTITINKPATAANIAALKAFESGTTNITLTLTNAQVLYVNGKDMYVQDATGAIDFYDCSLDYTAGKILNGTIKVTYNLYSNGLPEVTTVSESNLTATDGSAIPVEVSATSLTLANDMCKLVKVTGAYADKAIDGVTIYNKWKITDIDLNTFEATQATATGIVVPYNGEVEIALITLEDVSPATVKISDAGLATFCSDKALDFTNNTTVYAYKAVIEGSQVMLTKVNVVPAKTGVLLRSVSGGAVTANIPVTTGVEAFTDNAFVAVMTEIAKLETETTENGVNYVNYILNKVNGVTDFYKANGKKVAAGKAYLRVEANKAKDGLTIGYADETDGIRLMENGKLKMENAAIYNLSGQRVNKAQKGVYIVNGKKVVIR